MIGFERGLGAVGGGGSANVEPIAGSGIVDTGDCVGLDGASAKEGPPGASRANHTPPTSTITPPTISAYFAPDALTARASTDTLTGAPASAGGTNARGGVAGGASPPP